MREQRKLDRIEGARLATDRERTDDPVADPQTLGEGATFCLTLRAAGQPAATDSGIGGVDDDARDGSGRRQRRADTVDQAHEEALAAVGGLHRAPESLLEQAY